MKIKDYKITIIIPVYNSVKTIEMAIASVVQQTYENIELIVVDGGSSDGTLEILNKNVNKISCLISEKDKGIYDAMNKGINCSKGEIIYFLGSDDKLADSHIIKKIADDFSYSENIDLIYGPVFVDYAKYDQRIISDNNLSINNLSRGIMPSHQGTFVKRRIFTEIGLFDMYYKSSSDLDLFCKIIKRSFYIKKISNIIAIYGSGGMSSNKAVSYRETANIIKKYYGMFSYLKFYIFKIIIEQKIKNYLERLNLMDIYYNVRLLRNHKNEKDNYK